MTVVLAVAGGVVTAWIPAVARAQPSVTRLDYRDNPNLHPPTREGGFKTGRRIRGDPPAPPASDLSLRSAVPPDLDQRRRDGHMTPDERRLLRQHIEDAVRELYKR